MSQDGLVALFLATALGSNLVLGQGWALDRLLEPRALREAALHGVLSALVITLVSAGAWVLRTLLLQPFALENYASFGLILLVAGTTASVAFVLRRWRSGFAQTNWWLIATNAAVIGTAIRIQQNDTSLAASLLSGFASGCAFALALLLLCGLQRRLQPSRVPAAFRGLPIALLNAGLLGLAWSGLAGIGSR
jgi:electron transport complex protein RnfA